MRQSGPLKMEKTQLFGCLSLSYTPKSRFMGRKPALMTRMEFNIECQDLVEF